MKNISKQVGSAHIVIIVILAAAVIGLLGFVFWQNFISPKDVAKSEVSDTTDTQVEQKEYSNDDFSFKYSTSGWTLGETRYGEDGPLTPELKTADYQQTGMGVDKGAIISVSIGDGTATLDERYAQLQESSSVFGDEDLQKTTVAGSTAITYHSAYEGVRYHTIFVREGKEYDVVYMYAYDGSGEYEQGAATYMDAYDLVTSSFKFK